MDIRSAATEAALGSQVAVFPRQTEERKNQILCTDARGGTLERPGHRVPFRLRERHSSLLIMAFVALSHDSPPLLSPHEPGLSHIQHCSECPSSFSLIQAANSGSASIQSPAWVSASPSRSSLRSAAWTRPADGAFSPGVTPSARRNG